MSEQATALKVSFCITCKNRGMHLKETLPQNLANNPGDNVEFMILDYGDDEGIDGKSIKDWLLENYSAEIESGRIRYARSEQPNFRMAHAKNMAHRLATGDVLCNLDADNVTGEGFADWLESNFKRYPDSFVRCSTRDKLIKQVVQGQKTKGVDGRIAITKQNFDKLHGYNEAFKGWGGEDGDLENRSLASGINHRFLPLGMYGSIIEHSNEARVQNMSDAEKEVAEVNLHTPPNRIHTARRVLGLSTHDLKMLPAANADGAFGCGEATVLNRDKEDNVVTLSPQPHPLWAESLHSTQVRKHYDWRNPSTNGRGI